jgi:prepilin-type processing-associated H-X9-DG protein
MPNKWTLTLLDVIVGLLAVLLLGMAFMAVAAGHVKHIAQRVVCGTNLKGLGTAITVYANDYDDNAPQLPGKGPWSRNLGFAYYHSQPDFSPGGAEEYNSRTISASWYLLVREADVSPQSFMCPYSPQTYFEGQNPANRDITELWDFGIDPYKHVSYAIQNPYGSYPANMSRGAAFAIAADMSPWFVSGDIVAPGADHAAPRIINAADKDTWRTGNSWNHPKMQKTVFRYRKIEGPSEGQNVLFADGHTSFEKTPNCGVKYDNIYTRWSKDAAPTDQDIQGGQNPTARDKQNDAKAKDDSFLAI